MTLQAIENINLVSLADSLLSLTTAFILGSIIGLERQYRQRTAGLRTNVLVAVKVNDVPKDTLVASLKPLVVEFIDAREV